jgi:anti-sigma28 factor (negative regulator of flagellin synthesis)
MEQVKEIRERVERAEYRVDATAVADAIVRRLLEGRLLPPKAS